MLRTCCFLAIIAMLYAVRSTDAANCTATTFQQQLSSVQLAASKLIASEYASATKEQIIQQLMSQYNGTVVSFDYTVTQNGDDTTINYKIILACNETTVTVLPDGTQQTSKVVSKVDKTQVQNSISVALTDRANQVSLQAQQVKAGAKDTKCNLNAGGDNYFEWNLQSSASDYTSAYAAGKFQSASAFQQSLLAFFRTKLNALYSGQISDVKFVSQKSAANGSYVLTFRVYFNTKVTASSLRTDIASKIQTIGFDCLSNFFKSVAASLKIPTTVALTAPKALNISSKTAILVSASGSSKSVLSGSLLNVKQVSASSLTSSQKTAIKSGSLSLSLGGSAGKSVSLGSSAGGKAGVSFNLSSGGVKASVNTGILGGSLSVSGSKSKSGGVSVSVNKTGLGSKTVSVAGGAGKLNASINLGLRGLSGSKSVSVSSQKNLALGGSKVGVSLQTGGLSKNLSISLGAGKLGGVLSGSKQSNVSRSGSLSLSLGGKGKTSLSSGGSLNLGVKKSGSKTVVNVNQGNRTLGGGLSLSLGRKGNASLSSGGSLNLGVKKSGSKTVVNVKQGNRTLGGSVSLSLGRKRNVSLSSGGSLNLGVKKSGSKTVVNVKQGNRTLGGSVSLSLGRKGNASLSSGGSLNLGVKKSGSKTVVNVKQGNRTLGGKVSLSLGRKGNASLSSGGSLNLGVKKSGSKTVVNVKQGNRTLGGKVSLSLGRKGNASSSSSGSKTVAGGKTGSKTVVNVNQRNQTAGGSLTLKLNRGNGKSGSSSSKSPSSGAPSSASASSRSPSSASASSRSPSSGEPSSVSPSSASASSGSPSSASASSRSPSSGEPSSMSPSSASASSRSPSSSGSASSRSPSSASASSRSPSSVSARSRAPSSVSKGAGSKPTKSTVQKNQQAQGSVNVKPSRPSGSPQASKRSSSPAKQQTQPSRSAGQSTTRQPSKQLSRPSKQPSQPSKQVGKTQVPQPNNQGASRGPSQSGVRQTVVNRTVNVIRQSGQTGQLPNNRNTGSKSSRKSNVNRKINIQTIVRTNGQSQGRKVVKQPRLGNSIYFGRNFGVSNRESNTVRDITIDTIPTEYDASSVDLASISSLLSALLYGRRTVQVASQSSSSAACAPRATYIYYVYEFDIRNQVFNSSFQDAKSAVVQNLQAKIADWTATEINKRNLGSYVTDEARLVKIVDVSAQNNNQATLRFYLSINCDKNFIPVIRRVFETVGEKLQTECFSTSNKKIDWGNMVLIPVQK